MSAYNFRSVSNGDIENTKIVVITQIDLTNLRCEVYDRANKTKFLVYMLSAPGLFYHRPTTGEEWIVRRINGMWVFDRKTALQNKAIVAMKTADPGDVILSATNNIRVISPLIQDNETARWTNTTSQTTGTISPITALTAVNPGNNIATIASTNRLVIQRDGTYAVAMQCDGATPTATRAFCQIETGSFKRRSIFTGDDYGTVEAVLPLNKNAVLTFSIYHQTGSSISFVNQIDVTRIR